jgi:hypothetical protein
MTEFWSWNTPLLYAVTEPWDVPEVVPAWDNISSVLDCGRVTLIPPIIDWNSDEMIGSLGPLNTDIEYADTGVASTIASTTAIKIIRCRVFMLSSFIVIRSYLEK